MDVTGGADAGGVPPADADADLWLRRARLADREAVTAFTEDTWADRDGTDYVPRQYSDWIADDGDRARTLVVDASAAFDADPEAGADEVAAVARVLLLSEWEAWVKGMRVNPDYRRRGLATRLTRACFDWARARGARVARNWIHSWNAPSLGLSRVAGFEPGIEARWVHPEPAPDAVAAVDAVDEDPAALPVGADPAAAWGFWTRSATRTALDGLAVDLTRSWAVSTLTRAACRSLADEGRLLVIGGDGTRVRGVAFRSRTDSYERDGESTRYAEYGVGAWRPGDAAAAAALLAAVARDAAGVDADRARVFVPERPDWVSDAALAGADVAEAPSFSLTADLTDERTYGSDPPAE